MANCGVDGLVAGIVVDGVDFHRLLCSARPAGRSGPRSRKEFVLILSNQQGGVHVKPSLNERYDRLAKHNGLGWTTSSGDMTTPYSGNVVAIAVRQVAFEVLDTLSRERGRLT